MIIMIGIGYTTGSSSSEERFPQNKTEQQHDLVVIKGKYSFWFYVNKITGPLNCLNGSENHAKYPQQKI